MAAPLAQTANIEPSDLHFRLVIDDSINAFVTSSREIYVNTGLILRAKSPDQVIGVLAHELAHLKAQHHFRMARNIDRGRLPVILAAVAGIGAMAAGAPAAGHAILVGSQAKRTSDLLAHSRGHETEADRIALKLLNENNYSAQGLINFFKELRGDRLLYYHTPPEYLQTHPLSERRMANLQSHVDQAESQMTNLQPLSPEALKTFRRLQTKIRALVQKPVKTLRTHTKGTSENDKMAKAIAKALQGKTHDSLKLADQLVAAHPNDPFYNELLGLILLDAGQSERSVQYFERTLKLNPNLTLVRLEYADALLAAGMPEKALPQLKRLKLDEPSWPGVRYKLGVAFGQVGKLGESHLELAEEAWLKKDHTDMKLHITAAKKYIPSPSGETKVRLDDLQSRLDDTSNWKRR